MASRPNILDEIIAHKRTEVERLLPLSEKLEASALARNDFRSFFGALGGALRDETDGIGYGTNPLSVIAEVKKGSPSAGIIAADFDPILIAQDYEAAGADAISVLTDEKYFQGHLSYLAQIRESVSLPLLRKDFMIHEVQIHEAVVAGADAILLIVAALSQADLLHLLDVAHRYPLDVLVEVHDREEMERALDTPARIIGINNRNLKTFQVSLETTESLSEEVGPDQILVSESGIVSGRDAQLVHSWGADAILVGEALMRAPDKAARMAEFKGEVMGEG